MNYKLITTYIHDYTIKIQRNSNFFWHFYIFVFVFVFFFEFFLFMALKVKILKTNIQYVQRQYAQYPHTVYNCAADLLA